MELTTTSVVPCASRSTSSTSPAVRSSRTPSCVSSSRMGVTKRSSYIWTRITSSVWMASFFLAHRALAHESENRGLRYHQVAVALEGNLDRRAPEKERVITNLGLHRDETRLTCSRAPWLVRCLTWIGHGKPGAGGDDPPSLHGLIVDRRGRKVETDLRPLLALLQGDENAISDDDELLVLLPHHPASERSREPQRQRRQMAEYRIPMSENTL